MKRLSLRASVVLSTVAAISASLLAPTSTAAAVTSVDAAASALEFGYHRTTEMPGSGDITQVLAAAAKSPGNSAEAHVVYLPAGSVTVNATIRPANYVYLVAETGTRVTWRGSNANLLRFASDAGRVTGGVYGGTWDGAGRANTTLVHLGNASVRLAQLTVTKADKYGVGAYGNSSLTLTNVSLTANYDGVHLEGSRLDASGLRSTGNRRNGVQLSSGSVGLIDNSVLDSNGQAVKGSTRGKTGHGLGVASATAFVSGTSMSKNKVCGASLTGTANVNIYGNSHLDDNGRHGLGTDDGTKATISDSSLNGNDYNGVLASGKGTDVTLQHVTIKSATRIGLSVPSGGTARVTDSLITDGRKYDISVSAKGRLFLLGGNTISASRSHGMTVSGRGSITISGDGNLVTGSRRDGLRLTGSGTTGRIEASTRFEANRDSGIVVVSKAKLWMVKCAFSGNKKTVEKRSGGKWYSIV